MRTQPPPHRASSRAATWVLLTLGALAAVSALVAPVTFAKPKESGDKDRVEVNIKKLTFIPDPVTCKVGQTVRWTNNDDRDYSLMARDQSWKSGNLRPHETFEHKFTEPGKVEYLDMMHPRLQGTIDVQAK